MPDTVLDAQEIAANKPPKKQLHHLGSLNFSERESKEMRLILPIVAGVWSWRKRGRMTSTFPSQVFCLKGGALKEGNIGLRI